MFVNMGQDRLRREPLSDALKPLAAGRIRRKVSVHLSDQLNLFHPLKRGDGGTSVLCGVNNPCIGRKHGGSAVEPIHAPVDDTNDYMRQ